MGRMFSRINRTWNPISGCLHECVYCVTGDTLVLTADLTWRPIREVEAGDLVIGFSEKPVDGCWFLELAKILRKIERKKPVYLIETDKGEVKATEEHLWLISGGRWRRTSEIARYGYRIRYLVRPLEPPKLTDGYTSSYLAGLIDGGATWGITPKGYRHECSSYFGTVLADANPLYRIQKFLALHGVPPSITSFINGFKSGAVKAGTWASDVVKSVLNLAKGEADVRGYLAGIYDAKGSFNERILRISNCDDEVNEKIVKYGKQLGFNFVEEREGVRLQGGLKEHLRFLSVTNPAILEKKLGILGTIKDHDFAEVEKVKRVGVERVYDISTTSGTFFANGFFSHNCWARSLAETRLKHTQKYKDGFKPKFWEKAMLEKFGGCGVVFVSDMGDMFGRWIPSDWILAVLRKVRSNSRTLFLFLTKNPARYGEFLELMPENAILGATIETNLLEYHAPSKYKAYAQISGAPNPQERLKAFIDIDFPKKVVSVEPILDFDLGDFVKQLKELRPMSVYIGYDNYGHGLPEPALVKTLKLKRSLEGFTNVEVKTLRKAWWELQIDTSR